MKMICVLEVLAVLALVVTGIAIMVGALSPGDALRRVGVVLLLVLILPALMTSVMQAVIVRMLAEVRSAAKDVVYVLLAIAAVALLGWFALHLMHGRSGEGNEDFRER